MEFGTGMLLHEHAQLYSVGYLRVKFAKLEYELNPKNHQT